MRTKREEDVLEFIRKWKTAKGSGSIADYFKRFMKKKRRKHGRE